MQIAATQPSVQGRMSMDLGPTRFTVRPARMPVDWLALILMQAGDVEINPGPKIWMCDTCNSKIKSNQYSVKCNSKPDHWVHLKCSKIRLKEYHSTWVCTKHQTPKQTRQAPKQTTTTEEEIWMCEACNKQIRKNQISLRCNTEHQHWLHQKCTNIKAKQYTINWKCDKHKPKPQAENITGKETRRNKIRKSYTPKKSLTKQGRGQSEETMPKNIPKTKTTKTDGEHKTGNKIRLKILQINTNGINNKVLELQQLVKEQNPDVICIQESKLKAQQGAPKLENYTAEEESRDRMGGGVITYVKENIKFTRLKTIKQIDEAQILKTKLQLQPKISITISNLYLTPKYLHAHEDDEITRRYLIEAMKDEAIVVGDVNGHSEQWYEEDITDHRGQTIEELVANSNSLVLNDNQPTRKPFNRGNNSSQPTAPDITIIPSKLAAHSTWKIETQLSSDHLPIITTINSSTTKKRRNRTFTNFKKAKWEEYKNYIEDKIENMPETQNPHKINDFLTKTIMEADKKFIPKGSIRSKTQPIPQQIRELITERNALREANADNEEIPNLNHQIQQEITKHKKELWEEKTSANKWDHKNNANQYWSLMKTLQGKQQERAPNRAIEFGNRVAITDQQLANCFNKQYTGLAPKTTTRQKRKMARKIKQLETENIQIEEEEIKAALKKAPNKKSAGPDSVTVLHLKHLGRRGISLLAKLFTIVINTNTIPQIWKTAKIIPLLKPDKDKKLGKSYRPISLLSNLAKLLERVILQRIEEHLPNKPWQHGYKKKHSTTTALQQITYIVSKGFNQKRPPKRTVCIAVDMSRAFDVIDHTKLIEKIINHTTIPPMLQKFIANYVQGRRAYTEYNGTKSKQRPFHAGVPQGGVLSPILFNIFMSDMPEPNAGNGEHLVVYADDVSLLVTHEKVAIAEVGAQDYLNGVLRWMGANGLILADKTQATLFTPDPFEYEHRLNIQIDGTQLETKKYPNILGLKFDPKLKFNEHAKTTETKGKKALRLVQAIAGTKWGQQKETIVNTYKQYTRPLLEYACPAWAPIVSESNITKLQGIQNAALRCGTGHTKDTNQEQYHQETKVLPLSTHMKLITSQFRESARDSQHPLNPYLSDPKPERQMKRTALDTTYSVTVHSCDRENNQEKDRKENRKTIHTAIVQEQITTRSVNSLIGMQPPEINKSEQGLPRAMRRTLAQLRAQKCPLLRAYLFSIGAAEESSCPLCEQEEHNTAHLFSCNEMATELTPEDLWRRPDVVAELVGLWQRRLEADET